MTQTYIKQCHSCNQPQVYKNLITYQRSIKFNSVCNICSKTHQKKIVNENNIIELYKNGMSVTKISNNIGIHRRIIKRILIENNTLIDGRDKRKKEFNKDVIDNLIERYKKGIGCDILSKEFNISKSILKRIFKEKNILRKNGSNGKKIELTKEQKENIKHLYLNEYKNSKEISNNLNLNKHFIEKFLSNTGYRRNKSEGTSVGQVRKFSKIPYNIYLENTEKYVLYKREVMKFTNKQKINILPFFEKRGNAGINGAYHLDHKFSILEGFKNNISPKIIGDIKNLEFIPWEDNIKKRTKCSISIKNLNEN